MNNFESRIKKAPEQKNNQEQLPRSKYLESLSDKPFEILEKYAEKINFDTEAFLKCLKGKLENGSEIGTGQCADVIIFSPEDGFGDVCVKKIKEYPEVKINDIDQEVMFQKQVEQAGVRVPKSLFSLKRGIEKYIAMERIKGFSLKDATEIHRSSEFFSQAKDFNTEVFFDKLSKSIKKMHEESIYHRDLHAGNVMVEYETGEPVVIDFGSADMFFGGDDAEIYVAVAQKLTNATQVWAGKEEPKYVRDNGRLLNDVQQVDSLKRQVKNFLGA